MGLNWTNAVAANSTGPTVDNRMVPKKYVCGYCDNPLSSNTGYFATIYNELGNLTGGLAFIYICHHCGSPTYFSEDGKQTPGSAFGGPVKNIPKEEVKSLYDEARNCMKVNAYTAAVMCCRKLLMNVAVAEGAKEGKGFAEYVNYQADEGYLGAKARIWVDRIRDKGNDANHQIQIMGREDAEQLIRFSEMMLKTMYEYPAEAENIDEDASEYPGVPPSPA